MPTVMTHAVVGIAASTVFTATRPLAARSHRRPQRRFWIASALLPVLPDLDVLGLLVGIPFYSMWGHRGISHSLAAALVLGVIAACACRASGARLPVLSLYFVIVAASHGVLDALTNGGPGVAFFAPFDATRYFFPWRPIPVSPLASHFFSEWGWRVFASELAMIWLPAALVVLVARLGRRR